MMYSMCKYLPLVVEYVYFLLLYISAQLHFCDKLSY